MSFILVIHGCMAKDTSTTVDTLQKREGRIHIPMGGNAYVRTGGQATISSKGLVNWASPNDVIDSYIRFAKTGKVNLFLNAQAQGDSRINIRLGDQSKLVNLIKSGDGYCALGEWSIADTGYVKISLQGVSKTGGNYAEVYSIIADGEAVNPQACYVQNNKDNYFHWGRRGPSVHLNYSVPEAPIEWFYNEVTVPEGQDIVGSYFMANGFAEGYFGMQVNSDSERRILFSVWSPFQTDDPKSIPEGKRIVLLSKGDQVHTGEFGNEGSGGQSYLKYNWKAGKTYRFLLKGVPTSNKTTTYTAYFFAPETQKWSLIASFRRPETDTYLKRLHSFLENFIPEKGNVTRQVHFGNQWVKPASGSWVELTQAKFTADATARKGYRMDYAGGSNQRSFYLKNCGFFDNFTPINAQFKREELGVAPQIDLEAVSRLSEDAARQP
ncbi:DUF3472 domain-containing protein [Dyadobacter tibetensis]|uniref:DUF3472 domain-containing protein n=1 Tax=Dyadobacter tibetensis TaxID=1211851 RepID=UPI00103E3D66|nr:DUF3472 domain-containing protein [Dyadobacter tibetensis]